MNYNNYDPYKILNIDISASQTDIKNSFKKLALIYHPDKNITKSNVEKEQTLEKFKEIKIAYDILSDEEKKKKYDNMNNESKKTFLYNLFNLMKQLMNSDKTENILKQIYKNQIDLCNDLKNGNFNEIQTNIINFIIDEKYDSDIKLEDIFFPCSDNQNSTDNLLSYDKNVTYNESEINTLNIIGEIKTSLHEIYNNKIKEIIIKKKIITTDEVIIEEKKYTVPLYNPQIIINNGGDKDLVNNQVGNVLINVSCQKHKLFHRKNYNIIYNDKITLFTLFYGFIKQIKYFNDEIIELSSCEPLREFAFDGTKLEIIVENKGLPYDIDGNRGDLIINLYVNKSKNFYSDLKTYFNN
jgi:DnaJ-class molecular chaperone